MGRAVLAMILDPASFDYMNEPVALSQNVILATALCTDRPCGRAEALMLLSPATVGQNTRPELSIV